MRHGEGQLLLVDVNGAPEHYYDVRRRPNLAIREPRGEEGVAHIAIHLLECPRRDAVVENGSVSQEACDRERRVHHLIDEALAQKTPHALSWG